MRSQWVWLVASAAMLGGIVTPWGEKHILDEHCETSWDQDTYETEKACSGDEWSVAYRPLSMVTQHTPYANLREPGETKPWAYSYHDPEAPHAGAIGPLLSIGGPALLVSTAAMAATGIVHQVLGTPRGRFIALAGWGLHVGMLLTFLTGMAYHAGTWRAEQVDNLVPGIGVFFGAVSLLAGIPLLPERERMGMPALPHVD